LFNGCLVASEPPPAFPLSLATSVRHGDVKNRHYHFGNRPHIAPTLPFARGAGHRRKPCRIPPLKVHQARHRIVRNLSNFFVRCHRHPSFRTILRQILRIFGVFLDCVRSPAPYGRCRRIADLRPPDRRRHNSAARSSKVLPNVPYALCPSLRRSRYRTRGAVYCGRQCIAGISAPEFSVSTSRPMLA
jgi:hypothetical protein